MKMNELMQSARNFIDDEDGAQVIEYALIIAVVSIFLVIALRALVTGTTFNTFINRVQTCLTGTTTSSCT
jgi:pilus assembly protein Flp/PilA